MSINSTNCKSQTNTLKLKSYIEFNNNKKPITFIKKL